MKIIANRSRFNYPSQSEGNRQRSSSDERFDGKYTERSSTQFSYPMSSGGKALPSLTLIQIWWSTYAFHQDSRHLFHRNAGAKWYDPTNSNHCWADEQCLKWICSVISILPFEIHRQETFSEHCFVAENDPTGWASNMILALWNDSRWSLHRLLTAWFLTAT